MFFPVAICSQAVELHLLRRLHICEMASDIIPRKDESPEDVRLQPGHTEHAGAQRDVVVALHHG
eukprot:5457281-Heterocapsa_arctica.AAC.1